MSSLSQKWSPFRSQGERKNNNFKLLKNKWADFTTITKESSSMHVKTIGRNNIRKQDIYTVSKFHSTEHLLITNIPSQWRNLVNTTLVK